LVLAGIHKYRKDYLGVGGDFKVIRVISKGNSSSFVEYWNKEILRIDY